MTKQLGYIIGINSISELLKIAPERILSVKVQSSKGNKSPRKLKLIEDLESHKVKIEFSTKEALDEFVRTDSHQGFVACVKPNNPSSLKEFLDRNKKKQKSLLVCLDGVEDPHNLGAIFRAVSCFGADAIAWSANRGTGLGPTVSKSSSGASELVTHFTFSNLAEALRKLKKSDFWIVGAAVEESSEKIFDFDFPDRAVLVLGAEGKGLSRLVKELLDFSIYIPMSGQIDSLNVSQAAAVFLYRWASA
ncbi:MAG: 23S rRNA (guanosine(2251)-2'-O)-methyltransferase RlmB [Bdellovibrionales bacterium]|nr:23S rRNA (guanosine(2251)-2'-O)-methyltransferase RlmB [Bdellovibrionales bacterium]